jgi:hypothetical protein
MACPPCKFGSNCYRVNPEHLKKYCHPTERAAKTATEIKRKATDKDKSKSEAKKSKHGHSHFGQYTTVLVLCIILRVDIRDVVRQAFLVEMPEDFYMFWDFCCSLDAENPSGALQSEVGLQLVGPYDVIAGKFDGVDPNSVNYHLHWRYFYDPPELLTVFSGEEKSSFHMGYFRYL